MNERRKSSSSQRSASNPQAEALTWKTWLSTVTTSESREALEKAKAEKPDVIVMDMMMPYVTG